MEEYGSKRWEREGRWNSFLLWAVGCVGVWEKRLTCRKGGVEGNPLKRVVRRVGGWGGPCVLVKGLRDVEGDGGGGA